MKSIVRAAGSPCEKNCEKTANFFHSTWQSCDGSKGCDKRRNVSSASRGQPGSGGGTNKRHKHNPNFKPEAKSHPKEEWFTLSKEWRDAITKLRREAKQRKKQETLESKRVVAAVISDGVLEQEESAKRISFGSNQRQDQTGNQFGRHAHQV